ncbi:MAG TPA: GspH/FimT family pseudopilin [Candidatus Binatia bacterium]|nr:GspH/FimT family pseudopilin [Candidatus Binatia bacterium]
MPTSIVAPSIDRGPDTRRARPAGFTLIEVSLVLLIIAIVLALAIPRLRSLTGAELTRQARRLTNTFRFVRNEAILTGRIYQLHYDIGVERYWVTIVDQASDTPQVAPDIGPLAKPVSLPDPVGISDVVIQGVGKLQQGQVTTSFYPDGSIDPTVVHLDDGREAYTLYVNSLTGRPALVAGYYDVDYDK